MPESRDEIRLSEELVEERSFDELAKGLATGAVCRRKVPGLTQKGRLLR